MDATWVEEPGERCSLWEAAVKVVALPTLWLPYATAFTVMLHLKLYGTADVSWVGALAPLMLG